VRDLSFCAKDLFIAAIVPGPTFLRAASPHARRTPVGLLRFLGRFAAVQDLLFRAKDLFVAANTQAPRVQKFAPSCEGARRTPISAACLSLFRRSQFHAGPALISCPKCRIAPSSGRNGRSNDPARSNRVRSRAVHGRECPSSGESSLGQPVPLRRPFRRASPEHRRLGSRERSTEKEVQPVERRDADLPHRPAVLVRWTSLLPELTAPWRLPRHLGTATIARNP